MTPTLFEQRGERVRVGGNAPFALADGAAWLVASGHVDVFGVGLSPDGRRGLRVHLFRVDAGHPLLASTAAAVPGAECCLLAVGAGGTELLRLSGEQWLAPAVAGGASTLPDGLVERWVTSLYSVLSPPPTPEDVADLGAGEDRHLAPGARVRSGYRVAWVT